MPAPDLLIVIPRTEVISLYAAAVGQFHIVQFLVLIFVSVDRIVIRLAADGRHGQPKGIIVVFFQDLAMGVDHLQVVEENVDRAFVAAKDIHIAILRGDDVLHGGIGGMAFHDVGAADLADAATGVVELIVEKYIIDIGLWRRRGGCIVMRAYKTVQRRNYPGDIGLHLAGADLFRRHAVGRPQQTAYDVGDGHGNVRRRTTGIELGIVGFGEDIQPVTAHDPQGDAQTRFGCIGNIDAVKLLAKVGLLDDGGVAAVGVVIGGWITVIVLIGRYARRA